jgi:hypothetical protein
MLITLAQLRDKVRQRADMVGSTFVTDPELSGYINDSASELFDILVTRFEDQFTRVRISIALNAPISLDTVGFCTDLGVEDTYDIPFESFLKLRALEAEVGGEWVTLRHIPLADWRKYTMLDGSMSSRPFGYTIMADRIVIVPDGLRDATLGLSTEDGRRYRIYYIPQFTPMKDAESDPDDELTGGQEELFECPSGWHDYIVIDAAIKCLQKEESDVTVLVMAKAAMLERIKRAASQRDAGGTSLRVLEVDRCADYDEDFEVSR